MDNPLPLEIYNSLFQEPKSLFYTDKEGNINIDLKSYLISEGEYSIEIAEAGAVKMLLNMLNSYHEKNLEAFEKEAMKNISLLLRIASNAKSKYENLSQKLIQEHNIKMAQYEKAIEENKTYIEWYGKRISPIQIIRELWNNGSVAELGELIPPSRWKTGQGLGGEAGQRAIRFWMSELEEWGFFKTFGRGIYIANIGFYEALELLYEMKTKQGLKTKIEKIKKGEK